MSAPTHPIDTNALIVCLQCDAAYRLVKPEPNSWARCQRCHAVLIAPRRKAGMQVIAIALAVVILVFSAATFPFLSIAAGGVKNSVSVLDAALAFRSGIYAPLVIAVALLVLVIPLARAVLAIYVLVPMVLERPVFPGAAVALKWMETFRPWSMAEIFVIGCAVALTKISDLADITFGPAFWMFSALVVLVIAQDRIICRWSIWNAMEHPRKR